MQGTTFLEQHALGDLISSTVVFSPSGGLLVAPVMADFTPSPSLVFADFTLSTFDDSTPLVPDTTPAALYREPTTNTWLLRLNPPAGGWKWPVTATSNLPQVVYGYICYKATGNALLGYHKLVSPLNVTASGQVVEQGTLEFPVLPGFLGVPLG